MPMSSSIVASAVQSPFGTQEAAGAALRHFDAVCVVPAVPPVILTTLNAHAVVVVL
jgi:hypothetical protein